MIDRLQEAITRAVYSAYYAARDTNYRYGYPTVKRVNGARFRSYELYNLHGRDRLLRELVQRVDEGDVVYDIGANVGVYSCASASVGGCVYSFEPGPASEKLRRNAEASGLQDKITILPVAASDEDGEAVFHLSSFPETSSLLRERATVSGGSVEQKRTVETRTVDAISEERKTPDHIKIDVEGIGDAVLRGAKNTLHEGPTVYFESHTKKESDSAKTTLEAVGYSIKETGQGWVCSPEG